MASENQFVFWDTICEDAQAAGCGVNRDASLLRRILQTRKWMRIRPFFACVVWFRINQLFLHRGWRGHFRIKVWRYYRFGCDISEYADIAGGLFLPHPTDVTIGSSAQIGKNATIYNGVTVGVKRSGGSMPHIGKGVTIYTGAKIIGSITIGDNVEIGALSLCNKDVPANSVMYGIPPNVTVKTKQPSRVAG